MILFELYLPKLGTEAYQTVRQAVTRSLTTAYGGCTIYPAQGFWQNHFRAIVAEEIEVISVIVLDQEEKTTRNRFNAFAAEIKEKLQQESVLYVVTGGTDRVFI